MNKDEFRIKHSELIEQCIYLEDILKRYYRVVKGESELNKVIRISDKLEDNEMGQLINKYKEGRLDYDFPNNFIERLDKCKEIRNYYAHEVFCHNNPFNKNETKKADGERIISNLNFIRNTYDEFCEIYDNRLKEQPLYENSYKEEKANTKVIVINKTYQISSVDEIINNIKDLGFHDETVINVYVNNYKIFREEILTVKDLLSTDNGKRLKKTYANSFCDLASEYCLNSDGDAVNLNITIKKRENSNFKTDWNQAKAINYIVKSQFFKADFEKQNNFAMVIKYSASLISNMNRGYDFKKKHNGNSYINGYTWKKCYILSTINDYELNNFVEINGGYRGIDKTSEHDLEKLVQDFKHSLDDPLSI